MHLDRSGPQSPAPQPSGLHSRPRWAGRPQTHRPQYGRCRLSRERHPAIDPQRPRASYRRFVAEDVIHFLEMVEVDPKDGDAALTNPEGVVEALLLSQQGLQLL